MLIAIRILNSRIVLSIIYTIQSVIRKTVSALAELKIKLVVIANGK